MRRHHLTLLAVVALCATAVSATQTAALAQVDPDEIGSLQERRDELTGLIGELDLELERLAVRIGELEDEIDRREVELELVADDIEWTVFTRQEPAATRMEIAIIGFTHGDPRQNELLSEVRTLEGDDEPSRRRALYESVVDDTTDRLATIDTRLGELQAELDHTRNQLVASETALTVTGQARVDAGILRRELANELADVLQRIEDLKALERRAVLTGTTTFDDPTRPALVVKIDNVSGARPQAGINQADIVFVEEVEGGLTRFAAVFHSQGADVVGPVRSMRTGDFGLLSQLNGPLFANSGGNRGTRGALKDSTLVDIGVLAEPDLYYRDLGRRAPHNLFTNAFNLWSVGRGLGGVGTPSPIFRFRAPGDPLPSNAARASTISIDYGTTVVEYDWNGSSWDRSQDGSPTVDSEGVRVSPTTVVVQFVDYIASSADARSPEAVTLGDGIAWIFTDGQIVASAWSRAALSDQTDYKVDAVEVPILPGRVWIELPRPGGAAYR